MKFIIDTFGREFVAVRGKKRVLARHYPLIFASHTEHFAFRSSSTMSLESKILDYYTELMFAEERQFFPRMLNAVTLSDGRVQLSVVVASSATAFNEVFLCSNRESIQVGPLDWREKVDDTLADLWLQFETNLPDLATKIANRNLCLMRSGATPSVPRPRYWDLIDENGFPRITPIQVDFVTN